MPHLSTVLTQSAFYRPVFYRRNKSYLEFFYIALALIHYTTNERLAGILYTVPMKYLGIDYGTKRVGIAVSDSDGTLARPLAVLKNTGSLLSDIEGVIARENIECIVIGNSEGNKVQNDISELIGQLTLTTFLPVETMTEAFTSVEAHGRKGKEQTAARATKAPQKPADLDARAAAVILQRYLDTKSRKK